MRRIWKERIRVEERIRMEEPPCRIRMEEPPERTPPGGGFITKGHVTPGLPLEGVHVLPSSANVRCAVTQVNLGARVCAYVCSNSYVDLEV